MTVATVWAANTSKSEGNIVCPTNGVGGMFFRVTTAGTTGGSEPLWTKIIGQSVYDGSVVYEAFSSVFDDLSKINPSSIIELFRVDLKEGLNYATGNPSNVTTEFRFHSGSNLDAYGNIVWNGETYLKFPVEASGFAFQKGQLPRPTITISNMGTPNMSAILFLANSFTAGNDLTGAKVTRIRTMAKFVDAANFSGATNPFGTPDPNAEFPREVYYIDRKSAENRLVVQFELAAVFDMAGIRAPKRQCTRSEFPSIGTFIA